MLLTYWDKLHDVLAEAKTNIEALAVTPKLYVTIPDAIPRQTQRHDGYVIIVGYSASIDQARASAIAKAGRYTLPIDIYSPTVQGDYDVREVRNMLLVVGEVLNVLNRRSSLTTAAGNYNDVPNGLTQQTPRTIILDMLPYPNNSTDQRYHAQLTIQLDFTWSRDLC